MYDVIIIGKGPAGISAALYTARANLKTLIIGTNQSVLLKTDKIENYYGFENPISGKYLLEQGENQIKRIGAQIIEDEVIGVEKEECFTVITTNEKYHAKSVLMATGQPTKQIKIENLNKFEGIGISYCTTCDGFFYNNLKVGVLGYKDFAIHEAKELEAFTKNITIYTNGMEPDLNQKSLVEAVKYGLNTKKVVKVDGSEFLQKIFFEDGTSEDIDGLFVAYESASSIDFARKLGVMTEGNSIVVDQFQQTNVEGLLAAGDCTGGFKQISVAVGHGAMAGRKLIEYVRNL